MTFEVRPAVRADLPVLILLAGGTGSGKTESSLRLATGMSGGKPFVVIDTERGRALHKADDYDFLHMPFEEPFSPERYVEAIQVADALNPPVIVLDSGSHEWEGVGGILDIQEEEFQRLGGRESVKMASWNVAKRRHKLYRNALLRTRATVIVCHRAEDKIEIVKDSNGKTVIRPKESLTGAHGWIPICERRLPFEATISLLFTADAPGVAKPIKLERRHQALIPLDRQIDESVGKALRAWAAGAGTPAQGEAVEPVTVAAEAVSPVLADEEQQASIVETARRLNVPTMKAREILGAVVEGAKAPKDIPADRVADVLAALAAEVLEFSS